MDLSGIDLSAYEDLDLSNLDMSQLKDMDPADFGIDVAAAPGTPIAKTGPSVLCAEDEDPDVTGCTPRDIFIFYQDFNSRLAGRVRSGPYNVSTYQYARDCMLAASTMAFDPFVDNGAEEVVFDLRGIHNVNFWTDALYNLNHGRTPAEMENELISGDTKVAQITMSGTGTPAARNVYIHDFYKDCDKTRSELGGTREREAPSGTITASEYVITKF